MAPLPGVCLPRAGTAYRPRSLAHGDRDAAGTHGVYGRGRDLDLGLRAFTLDHGDERVGGDGPLLP